MRLPLFNLWQVHVSNYAVQPGARVLWCLRRRTTDVRCLVHGHTVPIEVHVLHDRDVILTEIFQEEWMALEWARVYRDRLLSHGWYDAPVEPAKAG